LQTKLTIRQAFATRNFAVPARACRNGPAHQARETANIIYQVLCIYYWRWNHCQIE